MLKKRKLRRSNETFVLRDQRSFETNTKLSLKSKRRMRLAKAENTLRAYEADWEDFFEWCRFNKLNSLPSEPETIVNYINDLADYAKANTISRRITAISENHIAAGYADNNPAKSGLVRSAVEGIRREKGIMQHSKTPLLIEDLMEIAELCDSTDIIAVRDKALLMLGFAGAFRRSELVGIKVEDLTFSREGLVIFLHNSKSDQLGEGNYLAIPYANNRQLCPVTAVKQWLELSELKSGPLFRAFTKAKKPRTAQLSDKSVALIVKKYIDKLGFDSSDFAGHSLRRGFATSAAAHDVDERTIMQQTRHKSEKMVRRYIEQGNMFKNNALNKML